ncbi:MAG: MATE family efflux transporter [Hyphomicrobiaceae bacterium]|nr:MATE family efflux transporter [Hyphomicrobiaceae bacterium]
MSDGGHGGGVTDPAPAAADRRGQADRDAVPRVAIGHRDVLALALPITLSNATVPLIGFVDTAVVGQLGAAHLMGAAAIGAVIFNMLYWTFSFLRMGTTGLTAQALGADEPREIAGHLLRALLVAVGCGGALVLLQVPVRSVAFWLTGGSAEVLAAATTYFDTRIWAAPAGLVNFALLGWLIGLGRAGMAFALQLFLNVLNIALALVLGLWLGGGVGGVAMAALIAENVAALAGLVVAGGIARKLGARAPLSDAIDGRKLKRSLAINGDLVVRSLTGYAALVVFTSEGARAGDVTLAANALLYSIMAIAIYLIDGFAFAAEALVGRAVGARDKAGFDRAVRLSTLWALLFAGLCGAVIWWAGPAIIALSAKSPAVQAAAIGFLPWVAISPLAGVWCFQLDGIFTGATRTRDMRNTMVLSIGLFLAAFSVLGAAFGNHGLWGSYMVLFLARAVTLGSRMPALVRATFG